MSDSTERAISLFYGAGTGILIAAGLAQRHQLLIGALFMITGIILDYRREKNDG